MLTGGERSRLLLFVIVSLRIFLYFVRFHRFHSFLGCHCFPVIPQLRTGPQLTQQCSATFSCAAVNFSFLRVRRVLDASPVLCRLPTHLAVYQRQCTALASFRCAQLQSPAPAVVRCISDAFRGPSPPSRYSRPFSSCSWSTTSPQTFVGSQGCALLLASFPDPTWYFSGNAICFQTFSAVPRRSRAHAAL